MLTLKKEIKKKKKLEVVPVFIEVDKTRKQTVEVKDEETNC